MDLAKDLVLPANICDPIFFQSLSFGWLDQICHGSCSAVLHNQPELKTNEKLINASPLIPVSDQMWKEEFQYLEQCLIANEVLRSQKCLSVVT